MWVKGTFEGYGSRYFWTVVLEKTLQSPLDSKGIKPVHPKGNHSWIFIGRTNVKAEVLIFWPPDAKSWLIGKDPDAGKDWRQGKKGTTEDEMVGWHHRLNGHELEQPVGVGDGQRSLVWCSSWGRKVRYGWATELNWTASREWSYTVLLINLFLEIKMKIICSGNCGSPAAKSFA